MTGWAKAGLIIGLAVIALVALNVSMWRRMKGSMAERQAWTDADFLMSLEGAGCHPVVARTVLDLARPFYHADVAPQIGDELKRFLGVDEDEVEDLTEQAFVALDLPRPSAADLELLPSLSTVGDWAMYLDRRYRTLALSHA